MKKLSVLLLIPLILIFLITGCETNSIPNETQEKLQVNILGEGSVTPNTGEFEKGANLQLEAQADEGWKFSHWEGKIRDPKKKSTKILINESKKVTAIFTYENPTQALADAGIMKVSNNKKDNSNLIVVPGNAKENGKVYSSIQKAVNEANEGTTILITPGIYKEDVTVKKDITIKGVNKNKEAILDGDLMLYSDDAIVENIDVKGKFSKKKKIGLVLSTGGLGDYGYNDLAYEGLKNAEKDMSVEVDYTEPQGDNNFEFYLKKYAENEYDLIIAVGFAQKEAVKNIAKSYPKINFAIIDATYDSKIENVREITFAEDEGSFLAGALAALTTKNNSVGFIGGVESSLIEKFEDGFKQGVKYISQEININTAYVGSFGDPTQAKKIANNFIEEKEADIIYHASGASGFGLYEAVETRDNVYAIGVDSNHNWISPGNIMASMIKRVDKAVYDTVEDLVKNEFKGGSNTKYNLAEKGVGLTPLKAKVDDSILSKLTEEEIDKIKNMKEKVTSDYADEIEKIKEDIINNTIIID